MAQFCVNIADDDVDRVIGAMCSNYGYQETIDNPNFDMDQDESEENPRTIINQESSFQFANRKVREILMENTVACEVRRAKAALSNPTNPDISDAQ